MLDFRRSLGSPRKETKSVRERSAGSFPEQRRVIEPTIYVISDEWAREEGRNKYYDGTRYNRAWVLGRMHHG